MARRVGEDKKRKQVRDRAARHRRAETGLCFYCTTPAVEGQKLCIEHRDRKRAALKVKSDRWRAAGKCPACGRVRSRGLYCKHHREMARRRTLAKRRTGAMVSRIYFIECGPGGPIKIGRCTGNLLARLAELQIGNPRELHLVGSKLGGASEEAALHARFVHLRIRGEWFQPAPDLLNHVASCG